MPKEYLYKEKICTYRTFEHGEHLYMENICTWRTFVLENIVQREHM